jgi:hypothetical protein
VAAVGERSKGLVKFAGAGLAALLLAQSVCARPIVFARSTTVMAEYRDGAFGEVQLFYAPKHNWSIGFGYLDLDSGGAGFGHSIHYGRLNYLVKRWNQESSQANFFVWGGAGSAFVGDRVIRPIQDNLPPPSDHDHGGPPPGPVPISVPAVQDFAWNAGGQIDFETRRFYSSFKVDYHESDLFTHRTDTLQLGFSPYAHDAGGLATWLIVSGRRYAGETHDGEELALLLRFFRKTTWLEIGANTDGGLQAMTMFTF